MNKTTLFFLFFLTLHLTLTAQVPEIKWKPVGLGGGGGQFVPSISPVDPDLMTVACDMSGVYITTNGGITWQMINFRELKSSIAAPTVFHPNNINIMWDDNGRYLKKSTDKGKTWTRVWEMPSAPKALLAPAGFSSFKMLAAFGDDGLYISSDGENFTAVSEITSATFLAGKHNVVAANSEELWISKDEGETFKQIPSPTSEINDVAVSGDRIYVLERTKLWETTDEGNNWTELFNASYFNRGYLRFVRAGDSYVWVTTGGGGKFQPTALLSKNNSDFEPVFFCNDSWDDESNLERGWLSLDFSCGWGGAAIGFNIAPNNPEIALWTDYGRTLMTTDAGKTWTAPYTKFADTGERTEGKLWTSRGLEVTSSWDIYIPASDNNFINIAYTDIGGAYSSDAGETWRSTYDAGVPPTWHNTTYDFAYDSENGILWGAFSGRHDIPGGWSANYWKNEGKGGVAFSSDYGKHWTPLTDNGLIDKPVTSVAIDFTSPKDKRRIFAAVWSDGIWRSSDGGATWERSSNGLDCGDGTNSNDGPNTHVVDVQVHPDGTVFALKTKYLRENYIIKNDAGLWRSTDHGDSWQFISQNIPECPPNPNIDLNGEHSWADAISFTLDADDVNHIYVGAQNVNNGKVQGGLYETTDGGITWERIYKTYAAFRVTQSSYFDNRMYLAASGEGILMSEDKGNSWISFDNFPFAFVTRVTEDPEDRNIIWVNTFGGGVWKGEFNNGTKVDNKELNSKVIITPNPATDYVNIVISDDRTLKDAVKVYDVLGVCVGTHPLAPSREGVAIRLDVSGLAAGVYFVRIGDKIYKFVKM